MKQRVYEILEVGDEGDRVSRAVDLFILILIELNVFCVVLVTVQPLNELWGIYFEKFEVFSVSVFSIEYLLRVWSCTANPKYAHPILGRLRFMMSPLGLIDLLAILPFFLMTFLDLRFLRAARLFRLFRVLKFTRYSSVMNTFARVIKAKKEELLTILSLMLLLLLFASALIYFVENESQPDSFSSIPAALWWGVATLTTVGYGDIYPVTGLGKLIASTIAIMGIVLFALPAGIMGSAFLEDLQSRKRQLSVCPHCGNDITLT